MNVVICGHILFQNNDIGDDYEMCGGQWRGVAACKLEWGGKRCNSTRRIIETLRVLPNTTAFLRANTFNSAHDV